MKIKTILLILIIALFTSSAYSRADEQAKAADFTLKTPDGETIVLSEVLTDKVVVLDFWASWCSHCIKVIPDLEKFYTENKDKLTVIGVNIKESEVTKMEGVIQKMGITYPVVLDPDGSVAQLYNVRDIPTLVAIDKDSKIMYSGHSAKEIMDKIEF